MLFDEREEVLREVCALGNTKAVLHFIHAGVKINAQNKMNGWTALHWASHRGQEDVVRLLLNNGADTRIKTNKGQTPLDLCSDKNTAIQTLLESQEAERTTTGPEPTLPIIPAYMKEPDLEKSWLMPDEFSENKVERIIRQETAKDSLIKTAKGTTVTSSPALPSKQQETSSNELNHTSPVDQEKEILVYLGSRSDENLLGCVFLKNQSMTMVVDRLKEELDDLPTSFALSRHNGKIQIPISSKQMSKHLFDMFRHQDDAIVIVS